jgi:hypothetical protein
MPCGFLWPCTPIAGGALQGHLLADVPGRSGRGYADFHFGVNFAITEFSEVHGSPKAPCSKVGPVVSGPHETLLVGLEA